MHRSPTLILVVLVALLVAVPGTVAAPYSLGTSNDVSVPDQTVSIDGSDYQIDAVGQVQQGNDISVSISVDGDEDYNLDLYNSDEQVVDWREGTGDGSATFSTSSLEPGTYALALQVDAKTRVIHPVVVSDYTVSVSTPAEATVDEPFNVTVDVGEQVASSESVEVGLHKSGTEIQATATHTGGGTYVASVTPSQTGDWAVYGAVRAQGDAGGYPVSTGIANGQTVSVVEESSGGSGSGGGSGDGSGSDDGSGGSDGSGTSDGDGSSDGTSDGTNDTDGTSDDTDGNTSDDTDGNTSDETDGSTTNDSTGDTTGDDTETAIDDTENGSETDGTDDGPIEPNDPEETDDSGGSDDGGSGQSLPLFVPIVALLAVAAVALERARDERE